MTSQTPPDVLLEEEEEDDAHAGEIPLTMAASVVLDHLPLDAHQALEGAGDLAFAKGESICLPLRQQNEFRRSLFPHAKAVSRDVLLHGNVSSKQYPAITNYIHSSMQSAIITAKQKHKI